jgi:DnaJ domain
MASDPYRILGLEPGASQADVKRAFRRLAKAYHPDSAGEAALPRFLAIHQAYEILTNTRPSTRIGGRAGSTPASEPWREPWRADPARARAARDQARARRPRSGAATGDGENGASRGPGEPGGTRRRTSTSGAAPGRPGPGRPGPSASTGSGTRAGGADRRTGAGESRSGARRRTTRKASLGSTSYDEARDPADPTWAGASWYGPTSGEYWTVNPREYADPRKHGPEYQSRARRPSSTGPEAPGREARDARDGPSGGHAGPGVNDREWAPPPPPEAEPAGGPPAAAPTGPRGTPLASILGADLRDPIRRLGFALLAWAPLGLAVAAVIGQLTGCASYSASCEGSAPLLSWLPQAVILGVLLLAPPLARILAVGTIAIVLAILPLTGVLLAFGGGGQPEGSVALEALLAGAWLLGVGVAVVSSWRARRTVASA